jgi:hypothetical protein
MPKPSERAPLDPTPPEGEDEPLGGERAGSAEAWEDLTPDFEAAERAEGTSGPGSPAGGPRFPRLAVAIGAGVVLVAVGGLLAYRAHHQRRVVAEALARALPLVELDTAAGYREAANVLEPVARLDPLEAASVRAFALAMLFADYRDADAEARAEALLVEPSRAGTVPVWANVAAAALAFARREAGDATTFAGRAGDHPLASLLLARTALAAQNAQAALEYASAAAAANPRLAGARALEGDLLRRMRRDPGRARAAYEAALAISPRHPRAALGLGKLALGEGTAAARATPALRAVLEDREATPAQERGRAALHLAALALRAGDAAAAGAALDAAGLEGSARAWAERAAATAAGTRGPYRAVRGAPASLLSASDDDTPLVPLAAPAPPERKTAAKPAAKAPAKRKAPARTPTRRTTAKRTSR